jgi:hypothetical protein
MPPCSSRAIQPRRQREFSHQGQSNRSLAGAIGWWAHYGHMPDSIFAIITS